MYLITLLRPMRSKSPQTGGGQPVHTHGVVGPIFWTEKRPFLVSVRGNRLDLGSPELGQALVAEAVPDVVKEVAAMRFGIEELSVLVLWEVEVSVDIAASETQVQDVALSVVPSSLTVPPGAGGTVKLLLSDNPTSVAGFRAEAPSGLRAGLWYVSEGHRIPATPPIASADGHGRISAPCPRVR
jgi:hypothetical protein